MRRTLRIARALSPVILALPLLAADAPPEKAKEDAKKKDAAPPTHTVRKELLRIEVAVDGVFEAESTAEIVLKLEEWSSLKIKKVAAHGARVREGEVILALDTEDLDRAIVDLRRQNRLGDLALKGAELAMKQAEETRSMDLAAAERTKRQAEEDLQRYLSVDKPLEEKEARFSLKRAEQYLEYELEELKQLEKMYEADDLTEETEEIVLRRQRNSVESAKFSLEEARIRTERTLKVTIPRAEQSIRDSTRRAVLAWERAREELPRSLEKQRIDLEKAKLERTQAEEKLKKLVADRAAMTVKSPSAGIVYYGACTRGAWGEVSQLASRLRPDGTIQAGSTVMTVVKPRPISIRANVAEKDIWGVRPGVRGRVTPAGYPDLDLAAIVRSVEAIPFSSGSFGAKLTVEMPPEAEPIVPGMACRAKLVAYEKKDALTVPPSAVETDDRHPQAHHVFVLGKNGKPAKRAVTVGKKTEKKVEILKGLSEGDAVLVTPPGAKSEAP
ncbi:MAG: HlyD family efflux transporter periplasmic adaptor subunit [Planctomycetes bacterium]|nr:HlyD family efflux transporter periplasmic adaptor subunit [Planctomycetota bacterium]